MRTNPASVVRLWLVMWIGIGAVVASCARADRPPSPTPAQAAAPAAAATSSGPASPTSVPTSTPGQADRPATPVQSPSPPTTATAAPALTPSVSSPATATTRPATAPAAVVVTPVPLPTAQKPPPALSEVVDAAVPTGIAKAMSIVKGRPDQLVIVLEETHNSPAGQIETAIVLNRLHEAYGLQFIGLEGAFASDGVLAVDSLPPSPLIARDPIRAREDVFVSMLGHGEISNAEAMAWIYGDAIKVIGTERESEYKVEIADEASRSMVTYLERIAIAAVTQPADVQRVKDLIGQKKNEEALEFVLSKSPFVKESLGKLTDDSTVRSAEEMIKLLDDIEAKAKNANVSLTSEERARFAEAKRFFQTASDRTKTMVDSTLTLVRRSPGVPVAMVVGAAHTEKTAALLKEAGVSFAVVRGNSLGTQKNGDLSTAAYNRKMSARSVDPAGALGALLDGRKKPPVVIKQPWVKSDAEVRHLAVVAARAAARGEPAPFEESLKELLPSLKNVKLVPNTMTKRGSEVMFAVEAITSKPGTGTVWVKAKTDQRAVAAVQQLLDERLRVEHASVTKRAVQDQRSAGSTTGAAEAPLEPVFVSSDTVAIFGASKDAVERASWGA
jgi:hypothetical protein